MATTVGIRLTQGAIKLNRDPGRAFCCAQIVFQTLRSSGKSPGVDAPGLLHSSELLRVTSVARDHRTAEAMVDAEQHLVEVAPDGLLERRGTAEHQRVSAAEDVIVFDPQRPVRVHLPFEA